MLISISQQHSETLLAIKSYLFRLLLFIIVAGAASVTAFAQQQSGRVYEFITLPQTARITAAGGYAVPGIDNDLGMALFYPSLVRPGLNNEISLNFVDYFADISYGTAAFSGEFNKVGNLTFAMQYISYGTFAEADELGNKLGEFSAGEYAFQVGWGRKLSDKFSIGSNLKAISSGFEQYSSFGLALDVAVSYTDWDRLVAASLAFRNMGRQITTYYNQQEPLPFDIVLGISKKLINAPLRFSFVAHNLHNFDLIFEESGNGNQTTTGFESSSGTSQERINQLSDQLLRHMIFGMEFTPSPNFIAGIGYNYRRRQELGVETRMSTVGLSWGLGIRVSHFMLHYGRSHYHLAGGTNHISVSTNLDRLLFNRAGTIDNTQNNDPVNGN